jgi:hypothetical protein
VRGPAEGSRPELTKGNRMDLTEFRESGLLQEANRQFFHPLGLALEVFTTDDGTVTEIAGLRDSRDDPEGMIYGEDYISSDIAKQKAATVAALFDSKREARLKALGYIVQPIPDKE